MVSVVYVNQADYDRYLEDLESAEEELRVVKREHSEVALHKEDGWHDEAAVYQHELKEQMLASRIQNLKDKISRICVSPNATCAKEVVALGSLITATIADEDDIDELTFRLVSTTNGPNEFSLKSPLGKAILGKKVNDVFSYQVGESTITVTILNIQ